MTNSDLSACKAFQIATFKGKLPEATVSGVQKIVDAGPEKWINLAGKPLSGKFFQRGLSGGLEPTAKEKLTAGADEFTQLLLGMPNSEEIHTSVIAKAGDSVEYLENVNRSYSLPFVIKGRAKEVGLSEVTARALKDAAGIHEGFLRFERIHSAGLFQPLLFSVRSERNYQWASNYVHFMKQMELLGIEPSPSSRGGRFYDEILKVWEGREWHYPFQSGFGLNELANQPRIIEKLTLIMYKYNR